MFVFAMPIESQTHLMPNIDIDVIYGIVYVEHIYGYVKQAR